MVRIHGHAGFQGVFRLKNRIRAVGAADVDHVPVFQAGHRESNIAALLIGAGGVGKGHGLTAVPVRGCQVDPGNGGIFAQIIPHGKVFLGSRRCRGVAPLSIVLAGKVDEVEDAVILTLPGNVPDLSRLAGPADRLIGNGQILGPGIGIGNFRSIEQVLVGGDEVIMPLHGPLQGTVHDLGVHGVILVGEHGPLALSGPQLNVISAAGGKGRIGQPHGVRIKGPQGQAVQIDRPGAAGVVGQPDGMGSGGKIGAAVGILRPIVPGGQCLEGHLVQDGPVHIDLPGSPAACIGVAEHKGIKPVLRSGNGEGHAVPCLGKAVHETGTGVAGVVRVHARAVQSSVFGLIDRAAVVVVIHVGRQHQGFPAGLAADLLNIILDVVIAVGQPPDLTEIEIRVGVPGHIVHGPAVDGTIHDVEGHGILFRIIGGQCHLGGIDEIGEGILQIDLLAPIVVHIVPLAHLVDLQAVKAQGIHSVGVLGRHGLLPDLVGRVKEPEVGSVVAEIHVQLAFVALVGEQSRRRIDAFVRVALPGGIGHNVGHGRTIPGMDGGNVIPDGLDGNGPAEQVLPGIGGFRAGALNQRLMPPHPVVKLIGVNVIPVRKGPDLRLGLGRVGGIVRNIPVPGKYSEVRGAIQAGGRPRFLIEIRLHQIAGKILPWQDPLGRAGRFGIRRDADLDIQRRHGVFQMVDLKMQSAVPGFPAGIVDVHGERGRFAGGVHGLVGGQSGEGGNGLRSRCGRAPQAQQDHSAEQQSDQSIKAVFHVETSVSANRFDGK